MKQEMTMTNHGAQRTKERVGVKGEKTAEYIQRVFWKGKAPNDFDKRTKAFLENTLIKSRGNNVRVFGNDIFIFADDVLITTFPMPSDVIKNRVKKVKFYGVESVEEC